MTIHFGDCRKVMRAMIDRGERVQMCVTSPPYFGLRDYGHPGQIGLESSPAEFVAAIVEVFGLVHQLLADDGTLWLNLGDTYARNPAKGQHKPGDSGKQAYIYDTGGGRASSTASACLPEKNLIGIPWRVAFALQDAGWYLRQDIIWAKPNPMPESVTDRCTKSHEYMFLLSKNERYYFDQKAIKEPLAASSVKRLAQPTLDQQAGSDRVPGKTNGNMKVVGGGFCFGGGKYGDNVADENRTKSGNEWTGAENGLRNRRSVWTIPTKPYKGAHFATFPPALIEPCILAGSRPGDIVLDPFLGSGTTRAVCYQHGRKCVGIELNESYATLQDARIAQ